MGDRGEGCRSPCTGVEESGDSRGEIFAAANVCKDPDRDDGWLSLLCTGAPENSDVDSLQESQVSGVFIAQFMASHVHTKPQKAERRSNTQSG
jgi:hypothetical protein